MSGPNDQRKLEEIRMLKALARTPRLGPRIRDAAKEEISARTAKDEQPWDKLVNVSKYNWQRRIAKTDPISQAQNSAEPSTN
jgi:hypothetical protein